MEWYLHFSQRPEVVRKEKFRPGIGKLWAMEILIWENGKKLY